MASKFDMGPSGDLAIFTNNSEDMFNIDGDLGPTFTLDQGSGGGIASIGQVDNLTGGITIEMPNEAPIDFGNVEKVSHFTGNPNQRVSREKIESNSSNVTIDAEPIVKKPVKNKTVPNRPVVEKEPPKFVNPNTSSPQEIFGFDDLLDAKKLKPINTENLYNADNGDNGDNASIGGDSTSTIRAAPAHEYPSEPPSPAYRAETPIPSTFQSDRERRKQEPVYEEPSKYANDEDEKIDLLLKLKALETRKGVTLSKHYNIKSSIDEIRMEYRNQTSILETEASVKMMKNGLIFCTSGMEYMNRRYDPIGAKLDGWGENIMENIMDFDGIFERLHYKYRGSVQMEPEMELLFALAGSAFMFHLSHTLFKTSMPQFGNVLRENPNVLSGLLDVVKEAAKRNTNVSAPAPANEGGMGGGMGGMGGGMGGGMPGPGIDIGSLLGQLGMNGGMMSEFAKTMGQPPPPPQSARGFKEPAVNDLYRQMVQSQTQTQNDDAISVTSDNSERSVGRGSNRATISPLPQNKRGGGGNVIKL